MLSSAGDIIIQHFAQLLDVARVTIQRQVVHSSQHILDASCLHPLLGEPDHLAVNGTQQWTRVIRQPLDEGLLVVVLPRLCDVQKFGAPLLRLLNRSSELLSSHCIVNLRLLLLLLLVLLLFWLHRRRFLLFLGADLWTWLARLTRTRHL